MRKKGLVEMIVMREPAESDFSSDKFPKNRVKLFSYMLKNKFPKIYKNHWLIAPFFLPLIIWGISTMPYTDWIFSLGAKEGLTHLIEYWFTVYVTEIPLWGIAFVGLSGGLNVLRKLAWSDPVIFKTDFIKGIRSSGKQMALVGLLWGVIYAVIRYAIDWLGFYYRVFDDSYSVVFGIVLCWLLMIVLIGITVYASCMSSMYNVTMKQLLVGAFKLYFADFFMATGVILASVLPFIILMLLGYAITTLIAYLLLFVLLIGFMILPMFLVCQHSFDRVINKKDYPEYYGRGLSYGVYNLEKNAESHNDLPEIPEEICETSDVENDFERVKDDEN